MCWQFTPASHSSRVRCRSSLVSSYTLYASRALCQPGEDLGFGSRLESGRVHQKRSTLAQLRDTIMSIAPEAEQGISYGMPAFKLRGKTIAGFAAFKNHLSYLAHSGSVIPALAKQTEGYTSTPGSLHFPMDKPLPKDLVKELLSVRMAQAFGS
jgi:uncharacterized protein YdhG (YjbR/CyaY superfamily)